MRERLFASYGKKVQDLEVARWTQTSRVGHKSRALDTKVARWTQKSRVGHKSRAYIKLSGTFIVDKNIF